MRFYTPDGINRRYALERMKGAASYRFISPGLRRQDGRGRGASSDFPFAA